MCVSTHRRKKNLELFQPGVLNNEFDKCCYFVRSRTRETWIAWLEYVETQIAFVSFAYVNRLLF